jgi:hypothetical protein
MSTHVKWSELVYALDWVSAGPMFENAAYINRETGEVYLASTEYDTDIVLPQDIEDESRYIAVPHKNDLDLGRGLVARFVEMQCPEQYEAVREFFRKQGAYARFKNMLEEEGLLAAWRQYETDETERALREWLEDNHFEILA